MEQEQRPKQVTEVRDPDNGKLLARIDHTAQRVELQPYRHRKVWVPLREFLDRGSESG